MFIQLFIASLLVAKSMPESQTFAKRISTYRDQISSGENPQYSEWKIYSAEEQTFHENGKLKSRRYGSTADFHSLFEKVETFSSKGNPLTKSVSYDDNPSQNWNAVWTWDPTETMLLHYKDEGYDGRILETNYSYDEQNRVTSWVSIENGKVYTENVSYNDELNQAIYQKCISESHFLDLRIGNRGVLTFDKNHEVIRTDCYQDESLLKTFTQESYEDGTIKKSEDLTYNNGELVERYTEYYDSYGNLTLEEVEFKEVPEEYDVPKFTARRWEHKYEFDDAGRMIEHTESAISGNSSQDFTTYYGYDELGRLNQEFTKYPYDESLITYEY